MIKPIALLILIQVFSLSSYADNVKDRVTQVDLQHHRWVLESINDTLLDSKRPMNAIHDLDFGEQMMVSYNTGCGRYSARARLLDGMFIITIFKMTPKPCNTEQAQLDSMLYQVFTQGSNISITSKNKLILETNHIQLIFQPREWVY